MWTPFLFSVETGFGTYRKTRKGDGENGSDCPMVEIPELDAKDRKCFEVVEKLIKGQSDAIPHIFLPVPLVFFLSMRLKA